MSLIHRWLTEVLVARGKSSHAVVASRGEDLVVSILTVSMTLHRAISLHSWMLVVIVLSTIVVDDDTFSLLGSKITI